MMSNDLGLEVEELAEVAEAVSVVAVEEYLVEAGEAEDFLAAVEFDFYGDDAATRGGHVDILDDCTGGDQDYGPLPFLARQHIDAGGAPANLPERPGDGVTHPVVVHQVEGFRRCAETVQAGRAGAVGADYRIVGGVGDRVLLEAGPVEEVLDDCVGGDGAVISLAGGGDSVVIHS